MAHLAAKLNGPPTSEGDVEGDVFEGKLPPDPPARPMRPVNWPIQIAKTERTIFELHRSHKNGVLILDPDYQRAFVWDEERQRKLVESVLARIPLPVVYLSEEDEDHALVIDGQQRLTTLFRFLDGKLILNGLVLLPEFEGKAFSDLDGKTQRRFENTAITCFVLQPGTDAAVKFQIFERLNVGAVKLNEQEIRNALFRGPGLDMVKRLAADTSPISLRSLVSQGQDYDRMEADEIVLRCLTSLDAGYEDYGRSWKEFLNDSLIRLNEISPEERASLEARFENALERTATVFGEHAFRLYNPQSQGWALQPSVPLIDVMLTGFDRCFPKVQSLTNKEIQSILRKFEEICEDHTFKSLIVISRSNRRPASVCVALWLNKLQS